MKTAADLQKLLRTIDRRSYPAYKETKGRYVFDGYTLSIDHVQGDPFASPSSVSIHLSGAQTGFPKECYEKKERRIAVQDYLLRLFRQTVDKYNFKAKGSGKSGLILVSKCGQEVLERTACVFDSQKGDLTVRMEIGFPANGRTICSGELEKILFGFLPDCIRTALFYENISKEKLQSALFLADDRKYIREHLEEKGLTAFVANGSVLPRESGVSDRPMKNSVTFISPKTMEVAMNLPHKGTIKGMGIKKGITLIIGGGYHGKSTLLKALELGVYDHVEKDGREYVITAQDAVKIRAEDGRSVKEDDISMFVNHLPNGKDTVRFSAEDASGSTSQAANVIEAVESDTSLLLIDEDTCATNFMVRDELMQRVVGKDKEPITPFIDRARFLYEKKGISCIIVAGSSGSYFHISDCIVQMDHYVPKEITEFAKGQAKDFPLIGYCEEAPLMPEFDRIPKSGKDRRDKEHEYAKIRSMGKDGVSINKETIDLHLVEQIADSEQAAALGYLLVYAEKNLFDGKRSLKNIVDMLMDRIEKQGLSGIAENDFISAGLAIPRKQEIFACLNRYRQLRI